MSCILTLALDEASQNRFEADRQRYFPPERNVIPAHLTLFHTLPETDATNALLAGVSATQHQFSMDVTDLRSIGRGVAYFLHTPQTISLHRQISALFADHLSSQDRQGFRPHVVVQNKVDAQTAHATLAILQAGFAQWTAQAVGLDLWRYLGGPWQHLRRFAFSQASPDSPDFGDGSSFAPVA